MYAKLGVGKCAYAYQLVSSIVRTCIFFKQREREFPTRMVLYIPDYTGNREVTLSRCPASLDLR
jgi:hypothetical protein